MNISDYSGMHSTKRRTGKRRIVGIIIIAVILLLGAFIVGILTSDEPEYRMRLTAIEENHVLKEQISELEERVAELEEQLNSLPTPIPSEETEDTSETDEKNRTSPRQTQVPQTEE